MSRILGWRRWAGRPVTVIWLRGAHETAVARAYATELAAPLRAKLAQIGETPSR